MIIAATGSRPNKLGNDYDYTGPISEYIYSQIDSLLDEYSPDSCIAGGALGVDTIFAICVLNKKIPLTLAVPFKGQETAWPESSQNLYNKILNHKLTTPRYVSKPGYSPYKMQVRNEYMVNNCDMLFVVWDYTPGGTENCVKYAKKIKRQMVYIDPKKALC